MISALVRIAKQVLQNVVSQLTQQINTVQQAVLAPINQIANLVSGGSIWRGDGASKFVQVLNSEFRPGITMGSNHIQFVSQNLTKALDIMEGADRQVKGMAAGLGDRFGGIVNF